MRETQEDIERLQGLLDSSIERAGAFLRRSFQMPEHSLTAQQLIDCWGDIKPAGLPPARRMGGRPMAPTAPGPHRAEISTPTGPPPPPHAHAVNRAPATRT